MAEKLLARDQKKGKEMIPSILCLVDDDFRRSHSPVFCDIITLSIHIALVSQEFEVLHKHFINCSHLDAWDGGGKQGQHLACFLPDDHSLSRDLRPSAREDGESKPKDSLIV